MCCLCNGICKRIDFLVFSDKADKPVSQHLFQIIFRTSVNVTSNTLKLFSNLRLLSIFEILIIIHTTVLFDDHFEPRFISLCIVRIIFIAGHQLIPADP